MREAITACTVGPVTGGSPVIDRGSYIQIWVQQPDGQWRFAREVYNSSVPAV